MYAHATRDFNPTAREMILGTDDSATRPILLLTPEPVVATLKKEEGRGGCTCISLSASRIWSR